MRHVLRLLLLASACACAAGPVVFLRGAGDQESVWAEWSPVSGATRYDVYLSGAGGTEVRLDDPLVRSYGDFVRADAPGLAAGAYKIRVVPVVAGRAETSLGATTASLQAIAHRREGYAFVDSGRSYVPGAYKDDGTPKDSARIVCVTARTANTVVASVRNDKGLDVSATGLTAILAARNKGFDKRPLILRFVGTVRASDIDGLVSGNYVAFTGANNTDRVATNITLEGVGQDALAHGYGIFLKRSRGIEIRNLGITLFGDDAVSMDSDNRNVWVHDCDFFYGAPGSDADQVKGDGSIDMKYSTTNVTISFNHFWDCGKTTFAGGATEPGPIFFTYHHNWFDHSDSRHPRLCWATAHVYNNFYDGVAGMGLLSTERTNAFVEANHYRNTKYPVMINMQGTNREIWPDGTQGGGIVKAFGNLFEGTHTLIDQKARPTDFDVWVAATRGEKIPGTVVSRQGGYAYSNFDTEPAFYAYAPDPADKVRPLVEAWAGRTGGGDLKWEFVDATADGSSAIDAALKARLVGYQSSLKAIQGEVDLGTVGVAARGRPDGLRREGSRLVASRPEGIRQWEIRDLGGKVVREGRLFPVGGLDLAPLASGTYFVEVHTVGGRKGAIVPLP